MMMNKCKYYEMNVLIKWQFKGIKLKWKPVFSEKLSCFDIEPDQKVSAFKPLKSGSK